jgi:hypothetical protein
MEDWFGVFAIVVVCGGVATLLGAIVYLAGPTRLTGRPSQSYPEKRHRRAPENTPSDRQREDGH